jgi:CRISPR-associated exonuclease Cas4
MNYLFIVAIGIFRMGIFLVIAVYLLKKRLGSLGKPLLYTDNDIHGSEVLYAKSLALKGKPDAIIRTRDGIMPLEIKTGRTPKAPRESHIMQLMAYCYLVEEKYHKRPAGGILQYSKTGTEFRIPYTEEAEESIKMIVQEILEAKSKGQSFSCSHPDHNT